MCRARLSRDWTPGERTPNWAQSFMDGMLDGDAGTKAQLAATHIYRNCTSTSTPAALPPIAGSEAHIAVCRRGSDPRRIRQ